MLQQLCWHNVPIPIKTDHSNGLVAMSLEVKKSYDGQEIPNMQAVGCGVKSYIHTTTLWRRADSQSV